MSNPDSVSKLLKNPQETLSYLIENECFIICPFLEAYQFTQYCQKRGIDISLSDLETYEKHRLFFPLARCYDPEPNKKGTFFPWNKNVAKKCFEEEFLWAPASRQFQTWEKLSQEKQPSKIHGYYSEFQIYHLQELVGILNCKMNLIPFIEKEKDVPIQLAENLFKIAQMSYSCLHVSPNLRNDVALICQIISNRYFPKTQTDQRNFTLTLRNNYCEWDWDEYSRNWDAEKTAKEIGITPEKIENCHGTLVGITKNIDPLTKWYDLVSFISPSERARLKGFALLAQTFYEMENMLRLFYQDVINKELDPPYKFNRCLSSKKEDTESNVYRNLRYVVNKYHLNPKPKLILVVEGNGEYEQIPRLAKEIFNCPFPLCGIEIVNMEGIGGFEGSKKIDKYGAFEKFIDDHHSRQTIVCFILDNEGRIQRIKDKLLKKNSKYISGRKITKAEYFHIWNKCIEFDNFTDQEIAVSMTQLCSQGHVFSEQDIDRCRKQFGQHGNPLAILYSQKLNYDLNKPELLKILCDHVITNAENEFNKDGMAKRKLVQIIRQIIELANLNNQPINQQIEDSNQQSGHLG